LKNEDSAKVKHAHDFKNYFPCQYQKFKNSSMKLKSYYTPKLAQF